MPVAHLLAQIPPQSRSVSPPFFTPSPHEVARLTQALRAHGALGCRGATRVDMIVSDAGNEYVLEVNTVPGLTEQSLLPRIAALPSHRPRGERRIAQRGYDGTDRRDGAAVPH